MKINPYLMFNGQCEIAFNFYERCLGGKIVFKLTYGESPAACETEKSFLNKIMHVRLETDGQVIMGSDAPEGRYQTPQGITISIGVEKPEDADRIFHALSEKASICMPIGETFWAQRFGMLIDQFGIPWMVNCEKKA